jgi:hypothetical protein
MQYAAHASAAESVNTHTAKTSQGCSVAVSPLQISAGGSYAAGETAMTLIPTSCSTTRSTVDANLEQV